MTIMEQIEQGEEDDFLYLEDDELMLDEEEEEDDNRDPTRYIPPEMRLSQEEENWAWELVRRVEVGKSLVHLTDFEYAVYALCCKGDTQDALRRVKGMQLFRQLYNVQDTVEEGMTILERYIRLQPGVLLHADVDAHEGLVAWNYGTFRPQVAMATEEQWKIHVLMFYYLVRLLTPTLHAVREGVSHLIEGNMSWENIDVTCEQRLHDELFCHDPVKFNHMLVYNTNSIANIAFSLFKPLIPKELKKVLRLGCKIELGGGCGGGDAHDNPLIEDDPGLTLEDFYLQPSYEVAMQSMLQRARKLLEMRYKNQESFQLSSN